MFKSFLRNNTIKGWRAKSEYPFEPFYKFIEKFCDVGSTRSARPEGFIQKTSREIGFHSTSAKTFIKFFDKATYDEVLAVDFLFREVFVDEDNWRIYPSERREEFKKKFWEILKMYYARTSHIEDARLNMMISSIDEKINRLMNVPKEPIIPSEELIKTPRLRDLSKRIEAILDKSPVYKHKCRTMNLLIQEADTITSNPKREEIINQLEKRIREHELAYVDAPSSQIEDITIQVIKEKLSTL